MANMNKEPSLSIALPTYNRAETLDFFLSVHVPRLERFNIPLYISDNASPDHTPEVIQKWQQRYSRIYCTRLKETVGADANVDAAIHLSPSEYTWLIGDTYEIPETTLEQVIEVIAKSEKCFDFILLNLVDRVQNIPNQVYVDPNKFLEGVAWIATCLGNTIYHRNVLENGCYGKYHGTDFAHVGVIMDYLARFPFELNWLQDVSIVSLKTPVRKPGWKGRFFVTMCENWPAFVDSLPAVYQWECRERILRTFPKASKLLGWRNLLLLRSQGVLDRKTYLKYEKAFLRMSGVALTSYVLFLSFLPVSVAKNVISIIECVRRKHFQFKRKLFPDRNL